MGPKRKAQSKAAAPKKQKVEPAAEVTEPPTTSTKVCQAAGACVARAEVGPCRRAERPPRAQAKGAGGLTVAEVWSNKEYVSNGAMSQIGFGKLCEELGLEEMSFEAVRCST